MKILLININSIQFVLFCKAEKNFGIRKLEAENTKRHGGYADGCVRRRDRLRRGTKKNRDDKETFALEKRQTDKKKKQKHKF